MAFSIVTLTLTDFTLHFSLTFTKLLYYIYGSSDISSDKVNIK